MVSLNKKFGVYFFISALVLACLLIPAELKASIPCCKNGKLSTCPNLPNGQQYDLSGCQGGLNPVVPVNPDIPAIEGGEAVLIKDCTFGEVQYKPSGSCGTSSRKCCLNGSWSNWDDDCSGASSCTSNQCWNGTKCEDKGAVLATCQALIPNTVSGKLTRTAKCEFGSGWKYGEWDGTCECADGYLPDEDSNLTCHEARYEWKILFEEKTNITEMCEDSTYSDTYLWKVTYGINDAEYLLSSDCKKYIDKYGQNIHKFNIQRGSTCYRYTVECVES